MSDERPPRCFPGPLWKSFPCRHNSLVLQSEKDWLCTLRVETLFLEDLLPNIIKDHGLARWQIS
jgi:hypothetical protein